MAMQPIVLLIFAVIALLLIGTPICLIVVARRCFTKRSYVGGAVATFLAIAALYVVVCVAYELLPGGTGVIAEVTTSTGVTLCITQEYSGEPYATEFFCKRPGKPWGWFYVDHEDTRWWRGSIELNREETKASILRGSELVGTFDLTTDTLQATWQNVHTTGVQKWMPAGWSPRREFDE